MKTSELRSLPPEELKQKLDDYIDELANLRIQKGTRQLMNPNRLKLVKKEIARIKTFLREYELGVIKPTAEEV